MGHGAAFAWDSPAAVFDEYARLSGTRNDDTRDFDISGLAGLPPSPREVEAFVNSTSPDAYRELADRLLASPRFGERWARHWLDVARYADTKGYLAGNQARLFTHSYTYRDYVIDAFNNDLPFDRFLIEQLAADKLDLGDDKRPLAAMGFLTLGRRFLNNPHDIIDDRIDVVTRGMMGLTVSCARCHDHKYDPVPTADYYSLYGVFASSHEPKDKPFISDSIDPVQRASFEKERKRREDSLKNYEKEQYARIRKQVKRCLLYTSPSPRDRTRSRMPSSA